MMCVFKLSLIDMTVKQVNDKIAYYESKARLQFSKLTIIILTTQSDENHPRFPYIRQV